VNWSDGHPVVSTTQIGVKIMDKIELDAMEVDVTKSEAVIKKAYSKYGFEFNIDGSTCRTWYDQENKAFVIICPHNGAKLLDLTEKLEGLIYQVLEDFDIRDVSEFLCKHILSMAEIHEELRQASISKGPIVLNPKPIDLNNMPLEQQCTLEVLSEQLEKTLNDAAAKGESTDRGKVTVTAEMVETKLEEKMRKPK